MKVLRAMWPPGRPRLGRWAALKKKAVEATVKRNKMRRSLAPWCTVILSIAHLTASWRLRYIHTWHCNFTNEGTVAMVSLSSLCSANWLWMNSLMVSYTTCFTKQGRSDENLLDNFSKQMLMVHSEKFLKNAFLFYGIFTLKLGKAMNKHLERKTTILINQQLT